MTETIETLAERLDRLEKVLEKVTLQLSCLVDELVPNAPEHCKSEPVIRPSTTREDKKEGARIMNELLEKWELRMWNRFLLRNSAKVWQVAFALRIMSLVVRLSQNVRNSCVLFL